MATSRHTGLLIRPLTPETWDDFEVLFGPRGACGGCWCMTPRLTRSEYERLKGAGNRRALQQMVRSGTVPGVLADLDDEPAAWCAIEPREAFSSLARSRVCKPVDDRPVWSIVCLFVKKDLRAQGLSSRVIDGAVRHARDCGANIVEAYPVEPKQKPMPAVFAYTGIASAYLKAGFKEVARRSETRPVLRRFLRSGRGKSSRA